MTRVIGLMVSKNEVGRYLRPVLAHLTQIVDRVVLYDDRSTDETARTALEYGCTGLIRADSFPSFEEDEGLFRYDAWRCMMATARPQKGDWILVNDCDEVLVGDLESDPGIVRLVLQSVIEQAIAAKKTVVELRIPEVFGHTPWESNPPDGVPLVRTDGAWSTIQAPRLFAYQPGANFIPGKLGVPAVPTYVSTQPWYHTYHLYLMHYGYAHAPDWQMKFERYVGQSGHSDAHVQSILGEKTLLEWAGPHINGMNRDVTV